MLSRVADTLLHLGRQLERAEHAARVVETEMASMLDTSAGRRRWAMLLESLACPLPEPLSSSSAIAAIGFDPQLTCSVRSSVSAARESARQVRERVSTEMFEQLNALYFDVLRAEAAEAWEGTNSDYFARVREGVRLFTGITDATVRHDEAYFFLRLGRHLERLDALTRLLRVHLCRPAMNDPRGGDLGEELGADADAGFEPDRHLTGVTLMRCVSAYESFLSQHPTGTGLDEVVGFLALDNGFPRSIRYTVDAIHYDLKRIAETAGDRLAGGPLRAAGRLKSRVEFTDPGDLVEGGLGAFLDEVDARAREVVDGTFQGFVAYPIASVL
ncbi:alpha-E domain-containing protein [Phycisphaera mikurensis]|uniref:DUF403 domain-containing protein n=1 Tax=Phycisphaera mikurensis (strain NBRC 102666 / KCTC 22515 / FYK2301M01) TaxID=1142394 RepID=I0IBX6_PHYMF|nr:alpha-E domain-containing protein [Phycisphaera mikurensis]MBB6442012.1 putative alpha-E superfamily protein [Phycisphaera mikurensis]BAM02764.1 hypothetical protein PSMK_06050 [Phycisphaera mikurensis NBRC 102666]